MRVRAAIARLRDAIDARILCLLLAAAFAIVALTHPSLELERPVHRYLFVVDVTEAWEDRMAAITAYRSQVYNADYKPADGEAQTFISNPEFLAWIEARARAWGYRVGATYGEPFVYRHGPIGITDLVATLSHERTFR